MWNTIKERTKAKKEFVSLSLKRVHIVWQIYWLLFGSIRQLFILQENFFSNLKLRALIVSLDVNFLVIIWFNFKQSFVLPCLGGIKKKITNVVFDFSVIVFHVFNEWFNFRFLVFSIAGVKFIQQKELIFRLEIICS